MDMLYKCCFQNPEILSFFFRKWLLNRSLMKVMSRPLIRSCHVPQGYMYVCKLPQSVSDPGRYRAAGVLKRFNIQTILNCFYSGARLGLSRYRLLISAWRHEGPSPKTLDSDEKGLAPFTYTVKLWKSSSHFWPFSSLFCHFFGCHGHKYAYFGNPWHMHNP